MNDGLEPETVDVILENRKLTAELAVLRQQLAEANKNWQDAEAHIKLVNKVHTERCRLHDEANAQLAAQAAELATLRNENEFHKATVANMEETIGELGTSLEDALRTVATLRERLAAAERLNALANEFTFYTADGGSVVFHRMLSETYFWCASRNTEGITRWSVDFNTFDEAHAWCIAAGWIPPSTKGEG